jgi:hypothetical protein
VMDGIFATFTAPEKRAALEHILWQRLNLNDDHPATLRFLGDDHFTFVRPSETLRFLPLAKLAQCLADHPPEIFQVVLAHIDLGREGCRAETDEEGSTWLVLDDIGVDLGSDNANHAPAPVAMAEHDSKTWAAQ